MALPQRFYSAISSTVRQVRAKWYYYVLFGLAWELLKDRLADFANKTIDENARPVMKEVLRFLEWIVSRPVFWTLITIVVVILIVFLHAYFTDTKPITNGKNASARRKPSANPLNSKSLFAYVNGFPRVRELDTQISLALGKQVESDEYTNSAATLEILPKFNILTIKQLDDLLESKAELIIEISSHAPPNGNVSQGYSLFVLTLVLGAELGIERYTEILGSSVSDRRWAEEIVEAYRQITGHNSGSTKRIPLTEFRDYAAQQGWDFESHESLDIIDLADGLRQAGLDGAVRFWGRPDRNMFLGLTINEPLNEIPSEHWQDFVIDSGPLAQTSDNLDTRSYSPQRDFEKGYVDLHVDRESIVQWLGGEGSEFKGRRQRGEK